MKAANRIYELSESRAMAGNTAVPAERISLRSRKNERGFPVVLSGMAPLSAVQSVGFAPKMRVVPRDLLFASRPQCLWDGTFYFENL